MSDRSNNKKQKGTDGSAVVPIKVEGSSTPTLPQGPPPRDYSKLSQIQRLLRVELQKDDAASVEEALSQLANLCEDDSKTNCEAVNEAGGAALIAFTMGKWAKYPEIQAEGCRALHNAVDGSSFFNLVVKGTGAIDAVIWAMKEHPHESKVQDLGCGLLGNFACIKSNADYIVNDCNGVELIIYAMNSFKDNAELQSWACASFNVLLNWNDFKDTINNAKGDIALFAAIKEHTDESNEHLKHFQETARAVMKKLLYYFRKVCTSRENLLIGLMPEM